MAYELPQFFMIVLSLDLCSSTSYAPGPGREFSFQILRADDWLKGAVETPNYFPLFDSRYCPI
jgi:hypothetical protein